jgi:hypothetical protein
MSGAHPAAAVSRAALTPQKAQHAHLIRIKSMHVCVDRLRAFLDVPSQKSHVSKTLEMISPDLIHFHTRARHSFARVIVLLKSARFALFQ